MITNNHFITIWILQNRGTAMYNQVVKSQRYGALGFLRFIELPDLVICGDIQYLSHCLKITFLNFTGDEKSSDCHNSTNDYYR